MIHKTQKNRIEVTWRAIKSFTNDRDGSVLTQYSFNKVFLFVLWSTYFIYGVIQEHVDVPGDGVSCSPASDILLFIEHNELIYCIILINLYEKWWKVETLDLIEL